MCLWDTSDAMMEPDGLKCIANAEYVLEGYLCHDKTVREDINSNTGKAMPEFPGYTGDAKPALPVIKITAVTHRKNPIIQLRRAPKTMRAVSATQRCSRSPHFPS